MFSIRLDTDTRRLMGRINRIADLDKKGLNAALGEALLESTIARFRTGKGPDERRWVASARASQDGGKTLVSTARLKNSIRTKADETGFAVGTNVIYASTHQLGAKNRTIQAKRAAALQFQAGGHWVTKKKVRITIPARPFLGISEEDQAEIKRTLEDALAEE